MIACSKIQKKTKGKHKYDTKNYGKNTASWKSTEKPKQKKAKKTKKPKKMKAEIKTIEIKKEIETKEYNLRKKKPKTEKIHIKRGKEKSDTEE